MTGAGAGADAKPRAGATLLTGATLIDADGVAEHAWLRTHDGTVTHRGTGAVPDALLAEVAERVDLAGAVLTPGFVDLHVHGGAGAGFEDGPDAIRAGLALHRSHGTTRSLVSFVAAPIDDLIERLGWAAELVSTDPGVLGSHLEGPFLAAARHGAHDPTHLVAPEPALVDALLEAGRGTLRAVTIAPELPGALDAITRFVAAGVRVGIGHTDADYDLAQRAFDAGATVLTHAYNAMPGIGHRAPGPVVAAMADDRVTLELILDGRHVHPEVARLTFAAAPGRVALITDAMAAAGEADGDYRLGDLNVAVRDGVAMLRGTPTIAGSTLTQDTALRLAFELVHLDPSSAIAALTRVPARVLGLDDRLGRLSPGSAADAVRFDTHWGVQRVWPAATGSSDRT